MVLCKDRSQELVILDQFWETDGQFGLIDSFVNDFGNSFRLDVAFQIDWRTD